MSENVIFTDIECVVGSKWYLLLWGNFPPSILHASCQKDMTEYASVSIEHIFCIFYWQSLPCKTESCFQKPQCAWIDWKLCEIDKTFCWPFFNSKTCLSYRRIKKLFFSIFRRWRWVLFSLNDNLNFKALFRGRDGDSIVVISICTLDFMIIGMIVKHFYKKEFFIGLKLMHPKGYQLYKGIIKEKSAILVLCLISIVISNDIIQMC